MPFDDFTDAPLTSSWTDKAKSAIGTGWRWMTTPLLPQIQQATRGISDAITEHSSNESLLGSYARGAAGGILEGIGNVLGDFTSPLGIATAAAGPVMRGAKGAVAGGRASEAGIEELIQMLERTPQGSRDIITKVPPLGSALADAEPGAIEAATQASRPKNPFTRNNTTPSGAMTDPLDPRFSSRRQGVTAADDGLRDPFANAHQPDFSDAPLHEGLDSFELVDPHAGPSINGSGESAASMEAISRQRSMAGKGQQYVVYDRAGQRKPLIGVDAVDYQAQPGETYGIESPDGFQPLDDLGGRPPQRVPQRPDAMPEGPTVETSPVSVSSSATPASADDVLARFFRLGESPYSASGKRRLLPEELTRETHLADTNLGESRGVPSVPSEFRPSTGPTGDPDVEWITRGSRYNDLPWGERKAAITQDERYNHLLGDDSGYIDVSQLPELAEGANKFRYFSMLSSPATQAKNILGNVGAVTTHAAETALGGRPRDAVRVLSEFFNPQTVRDAVSEYRNPVNGVEGRWGSESGVLGVPGRIMGAIDRGTKDALARAGVGQDLAEEVTFTNRPKSEVGQAFGDALNRSSVGKLLVPFSKTATNILERGLERTPIIGSIAERLSGGNLKTSLPKQILGGIAMAGGAAANHSDPYLDALLAPLSVPYSLGSGMATAAEKVGSTSADVLQAAIQKLADAAPLPTKDYTLDPRQYIASYVPNILRDVNDLTGVDPTSFDTSHSLLGKAIAKIPFFNELLLHHKSRANNARSPR